MNNRHTFAAAHQRPSSSSAAMKNRYFHQHPSPVTPSTASYPYYATVKVGPPVPPPSSAQVQHFLYHRPAYLHQQFPPTSYIIAKRSPTNGPTTNSQNRNNRIWSATTPNSNRNNSNSRPNSVVQIKPTRKNKNKNDEKEIVLLDVNETGSPTPIPSLINRHNQFDLQSQQQPPTQQQLQLQPQLQQPSNQHRSMAKILMNGGTVVDQNSVNNVPKLNHLNDKVDDYHQKKHHYKNRQRRLSIEESEERSEEEEEDEEEEITTESSNLSTTPELKTRGNDVTTSGSLQFLSTIVTINDNSNNNSSNSETNISDQTMMRTNLGSYVGGDGGGGHGDIDPEKALHPGNGGFVRFGLGPQPPLPPPPPPSRSLPSTNSIKKSPSSSSSTSGAAGIGGSRMSSSVPKSATIVNLICSRVLMFLYIFLLLGVAFVGGFIFAQHYFRSYPTCDPSSSSSSTSSLSLSSSSLSSSTKLNPNHNSNNNFTSFNNNRDNLNNFSRSNSFSIDNLKNINENNENNRNSNNNNNNVSIFHHKVLPPSLNSASFVDYANNNDNSSNDGVHAHHNQTNVNNKQNNNSDNNNNSDDNDVGDNDFVDDNVNGNDDNFNWRKIVPIESNLKNNSSMIEVDTDRLNNSSSTTTTTSTTTQLPTTAEAAVPIVLNPIQPIVIPLTTTIATPDGSTTIDASYSSTTTAQPQTSQETTVDPMEPVAASSTMISFTTTLLSSNFNNQPTPTTTSSFQTDLADTVSSEFDEMFHETVRSRFPLGNNLETDIDRMLSTEIKPNSILPLTTPVPGLLRDIPTTTDNTGNDDFNKPETTTQPNLIESSITAFTGNDNFTSTTTTVSSMSVNDDESNNRTIPSDIDITVTSSSELSPTTVKIDVNSSSLPESRSGGLDSLKNNSSTITTLNFPTFLMNDTRRKHKSLTSSGSIEDDDDIDYDNEHIFVSNHTSITPPTLTSNSTITGNITDISAGNSTSTNGTIAPGDITTTITENKAKLELMNLATFDNQDFCLETQFLCPAKNSSSSSDSSDSSSGSSGSSDESQSSSSSSSSTTSTTTTPSSTSPNKCLDEVKKCDGIVDCPNDRFDELNCKLKKCQQNFMCGLPRFVPPSAVGNGTTSGAGALLTMMQMSPSSQHNTTIVGADGGNVSISVSTVLPPTVSSTTTTTTSTTAMTMKRTDDEDNVQCIPRLNYCDGIWDCADGSDEIECQIVKCRPNEIKCRDSSACLTGKQACDGVYNCRDHSDEIGCVSRSSCELSGRFFCDNGLCIERSLVCDGRPDCHNGTDEHNCQTSETCTKSSGKFLCQSGECIDSSRRCDGHVDCLDYSDEDLCYESDQDGIVHIYNANTDNWSLLCVSENFTQSNANTICSRLARDYATNFTLIEISRLLGNSTWAHLVNASQIVNQTMNSTTIANRTTTVSYNFTDSYFGQNQSIVHSSWCRSNYTVTIECQAFACSLNSQQPPPLPLPLPPPVDNNQIDGVNGNITASESVNNNNVASATNNNNNVNVGLKTPEEMPSPLFIGKRSTVDSQTPPSLEVVTKCPAYVIAYRWLLTSGQCLKNLLIKSTIKDLLIENSQKSWNSSVEQIRFHPKYSIFRTIRFPDYDTALVEFDANMTNIEQSSLSSSICLPATKLDPEITCFIGAYGSGEAAYEVLELANCNSSNHFAGSLTNRHLCARPANVGTSQFSCLPYYLPLSCLTSQSQWYLSGFVTYQHGCSVDGKKTKVSYQPHPTLFSNLFLMKSFIDQTTGSGTYRKERPKISLNQITIATTPSSAINNGTPSSDNNNDGNLLPPDVHYDGGLRPLYILRADEPRSPKQFNISNDSSFNQTGGDFNVISNNSLLIEGNITSTNTTEVVTPLPVNNTTMSTDDQSSVNGTNVESVEMLNSTETLLPASSTVVPSEEFNSTIIVEEDNEKRSLNSTKSTTTTTAASNGIITTISPEVNITGQETTSVSTTDLEPSTTITATLLNDTLNSTTTVEPVELESKISSTEELLSLEPEAKFLVEVSSESPPITTLITTTTNSPVILEDTTEKTFSTTTTSSSSFAATNSPATTLSKGIEVADEDDAEDVTMSMTQL